MGIEQTPPKFVLSEWERSVREYAEEGLAAVKRAFAAEDGPGRDQAMEEMRVADRLLHGRIGFDPVIAHLNAHDALVKALKMAKYAIKGREHTGFIDAALRLAGKE